MSTTNTLGKGGYPAQGGFDEARLFRRRDLNEIVVNGSAGYQNAVGIHIYCELRPTEALQAAESDEVAGKYLEVIQEYVTYGVAAASQSDVDLLEVQGNVLHFFKQGALNPQTALDAIRFVHIFTATVYARLKPKMGEGNWHGFASCMDHGPAILLRHGAASTSSTISLGCAANRPAKQLLHGKTPAGCIDVPGEWGEYISTARKVVGWITIKLTDREWAPLARLFEDREPWLKLNALLEAVEKSSATMPPNAGRVMLLANEQLYANPEGFSVDQPYRLEAFCLRCDLDGFSAAVEEATRSGDEAMDKLAKGFDRILDFGDYIQTITPGSVRLPWAGDCATLVVPAAQGESLVELREWRWLRTALEWQSFASERPENATRGWSRQFKNVSWSIGGACGDAALCLVAPIVADGRRFLIGAGWPFSTALDAQEKGKGGDIVVHQIDRGNLPEHTKRLFAQIGTTDYWKAANLTTEKLKRSHIEAGRTRNQAPQSYSRPAPSIVVPGARPYYS